MGENEQATKKLTARLSEAAAGSGSAVGALQRLNLTAADLQTLPLDQRIVAIQEALNRFVPEAERAAVASDLFGDKAALAFLRIRYKDWADYKSALPSQAIIATDQQIGIGTGSLPTFQLAKSYTSGTQTWVRTIAKPVAGTVRVALAMVEQMSG